MCKYVTFLFIRSKCSRFPPGNQSLSNSFLNHNFYDMNFLQIKYPKVDVQYNCGCGHQFMKCPERMHLREVFLGQTNFCWSLSVFLSALSELFMKAKRKKTFFVEVQLCHVSCRQVSTARPESLNWLHLKSVSAQLNKQTSFI